MGRINNFVSRVVVALLLMLCGFSSGVWAADESKDYIQMSATKFTAYPGQQDVSLPSAYMYVDGALSDNYNLYYKIEGGKEYTDAASGMVYSMHESTGTVINELSHKITVGSNVKEKVTLTVSVIAKPKYKSTIEKGVTTSFELIISPLETTVSFKPSDELTLGLNGSCKLPTPEVKYGFEDISNKYIFKWGNPSDVNLVSISGTQIIAAQKEGTCTIPFTATSDDVAYTTLSGSITVHVKSGSKIVYVSFPNNGVQTEYQGLNFQFGNMAAVQSTVPVYQPIVFDQEGNDITTYYDFTFDFTDPIEEKEVQLANTYYSQDGGLTKKTTWTKKTVCYNKRIGNGCGELVLGTLDEKFNEREFPIYFKGKSKNPATYPDCSATLTLRLIPRVPEFTFVPNPEQTVFRTGYLMSQINRFTPSGEWVNENNGHKAIIEWNSGMNGKLDSETDKFKFGYLFAVEKAKIDEGFIRVEEGNSKFKATRNGYNIYFSTLGWNTQADTWNIYISKACRFNIKYIVNYNSGVEGQFRGGNDIDDPTYWKDLVVTAKERIVPTMNIDPDYIVTSPNKTVNAPKITFVANDSYLDQVVYSPMGRNIRDFYDITYKLSDPSNLCSSFNQNTGEVKIKEMPSISANNTITVKVIATPKKNSDLGELLDAEGNILSNPYKDISGSYTIKVIADYSNYYEIIKDKKKPKLMGKLHFINSSNNGKTGEVIGGVAFTGIAGLDVTFGNQFADSDQKWYISNNPKLKGASDNNNDKNSFWFLQIPNVVSTTSVGDVSVPNNAIKLNPYTNGFVTLDYVAYWNKTPIDLKLIDSDGKVIASYSPSSTKGNHDKSAEYVFAHSLKAGKTYYLYNENGTDNGIYVHGINYAPAFVMGENSSDSTKTASGFENNFSGALPSLIVDETEYVSFKSSNPKVATVDEKTGVVNPISKGTATIYGYVESAEDGVLRRPSYTITVEDIPYYKVDNENAQKYTGKPSVGYQVSTQNYPTDITMTFGGHTSSYKLVKDGEAKSYKDGWKDTDIDYVGGSDNEYVIDGFSRYSQGTNDVFDEKKKSYSQYDFKENNSGSNNTFTLPSYGTYVKFEPRESGTLIVYLLQNGICDYQARNYKDGYNFKEENNIVYQTKWRPLYIVDQKGKPVDINANYSGIETNAGFFTKGRALSVYDDPNVKKYIDANVANPKYIGNCTFDWSKFFSWYTETGTTPNEKTALTMGAQDRAEELIKKWKEKNLYDSEDIIKVNNSSFVTLHKSYVRYTFNVKAGDTYFVFQYGSKLGLCGFSFVPDNWNTQKDMQVRQSDRPIVVLDNNIGYDNSETRDNVNVTMKNRTFKDNTWASICLPFNVSQNEFYRVFGDYSQIINLDDIRVDNGHNIAYFMQHDHRMIEAGRPYFIKPTSISYDGGNNLIQFQHVTFSNPDPSVFDIKTDQFYRMVGTLKNTDTYMNPYSYAMGSDGELHRYVNKTKIKPYRAYLSYEGTTADAKAWTLFGMNDGEEVTSISGISDSKENKVDSNIYNIQGQFVGTNLSILPPGVYVVKGKKIIVK